MKEVLMLGGVPTVHHGDVLGHYGPHRPQVLIGAESAA